MRTPRLALAASAVLVATGLAVPSLAAETVTTTHGCIESVPEPGSTTPVKICWTVHQPAGTSADIPAPMVMHSHGWGGSRSRNASSFTSWLAKGFGILSFDQRGFGESGGLAHVENPDLEGQDVMRLVDLVGSLDWVAKEAVPASTTSTGTRTPGRSGGKGQGDKDGHTTTTSTPAFAVDPVLGAIGGSYGGGYQFVGAFTELRDKGATRFDALAPEITWWDLKESLAPEEVPRTTWQTALQALGVKDEPTELQAGSAYGTATGQWPGTGNPVADLDAFFLKNGPAWHVSQGRQLDIPVLFGQGITDNLFNLNQGLKNFDQALTDDARARSIFVGYNGGHALPNALPAGYGTSGDPCSDQLGSPSFSQLSQRFMQENLTGLATGLAGFGQYHLADVNGASCFTVDTVEATTPYELGTVATTTGAGAPVAHQLAAGPLRVAGQPLLEASVTAAGVENRAFFALSVGTSPANARVVANNVMPLREALPVQGKPRTIELPAVAVDIEAGEFLYLTVSPLSDMFVAHGSRTPGAMLLQGTTVHVPVQQ
jgi:ABC-2 type transport system ATP-binding protein